MEPTAIGMPQGKTLDGVVTAWKQWRCPSGIRKADAPEQAEDEPCRMGDFAGYDQNAKSYMESYEVFGDLDKAFLPIRKGMMGIKLVINSKTGASISPHEFKLKNANGADANIDLSDTCLTIVVANLTNRGKFLIAQSDRTMSDAFIESLWNTATSKGELEVRMDLSDATDSEINSTIGSGAPDLFMAVGLAEPIDAGIVKAYVGNAMYVTTSGDLPFTLVNFNMWNEDWQVAAICHGFAINFNHQFFFDLPYVGSGKPTATLNKTTSGSRTLFNIAIGGKFFMQSLFEAEHKSR